MERLYEVTEISLNGSDGDGDSGDSEGGDYGNESVNSMEWVTSHVPVRSMLRRVGRRER